MENNPDTSRAYDHTSLKGIPIVIISDDVKVLVWVKYK
jgi:hypothetical protein